jgi:dolichyl-phosphate beta-glucosyltransferase
MGSAWLEIVVPAHNEEARLADGLATLCAKAADLPPGVEIIVVDSASTDQTGAIVRNWQPGPVPVRLIRCDKPGKGAAVRAGLLATTARFVGFCDADMATDLTALDVAIRHLVAGREVVIGSRAHPASVVSDRHSRVRRAGAALFRGLAGLVTPGVGDTQCGFKFFAGPVARRAAEALRTTGYAFDIELIANCRLLGADMVEIPVTWQDVPGSTFSAWRHSVGACREVARIWLILHSGSASAWATSEPQAPEGVGSPSCPLVPGSPLPASVGPVSGS